MKINKIIAICTILITSSAYGADEESAKKDTPPNKNLWIDIENAEDAAGPAPGWDQDIETEVPPKK